MNIVIFLVALIFVDISVASVAAKLKLVGKIESFDAENVNMKSGNRIYKFSKAQLKHPTYSVGDPLEIEISRQELANLKSKSAK